MDLTAWQTPAALTVVALTALLFLRRYLRARRHPKSCTNCGSAPTPKRK
jgi:hypothetical protein